MVYIVRSLTLTLILGYSVHRHILIGIDHLIATSDTANHYDFRQEQ